MRASADLGPPVAGASVLVIDDDPTVSDVVGRYLARAGYDVRRAGDGAVALQLHAERPADLLVLDVTLPGVDGLEVLRRLRQVSRDSPRVILLTGRDEERDRITGFSHGADDYVVKPFSPREIVARVDAVLRRGVQRAVPAVPTAGAIEAGPLHVDLAGRRTTYAGALVGLTNMEYDLLVFLASAPGVARSREELMERVWGNAELTDTSTVTVHVRRLRRKLAAHAGTREFITTVWGVGYRFDAGSRDR